jgi:hypothetical protein
MSLLLWQQRPDIGPTAQRGAAMTYVASTGKTLLWGGLGDEGSSKEAWEFEGDGWVQVGDTGPRPIAGAATRSVPSRTRAASSGEDRQTFP